MLSNKSTLLLAYLKATGEEFEAGAELSAVEQPLQGGQALQSHLALLKLHP